MMPQVSRLNKVLVRRVIGYGLTALILLTAAFLTAQYFWDVCITESRGKITNLSGYDFEISETNCDLIAKDDAVSVLVSRTGQTKQTPVFKFGPAREVRPIIKLIDPHTIQISIAWVSDVYFKNDKWEDLSIEYDIGRIDYPSSSGQTKD